jgi:hypothetical protein
LAVSDVLGLIFGLQQISDTVGKPEAFQVRVCYFLILRKQKAQKQSLMGMKLSLVV